MSDWTQITIAVLVSLVALYLAYRWKFFRLPQKETQPHLLSLHYLLGAFFVFIGIQVFSVPLLGFFWIFLKTGSVEHLRLGMPTQGWISILGIGIVGLGIFGYFRLLDPESQRLIWNQTKKFNKLNSFKQFLFGTMTWLIAYPIVSTTGEGLALIFYFFFGVEPADQTPVKTLKTSFDYPFVFFFMAVEVTFLIPIIEELLFRGFIQTWLKNYLSRMSAIVLTALIFAMFHYSPEQGVTNIEFITALFVLSCFLGFLYERQKSLWAPIGLHVTFNAMSVLSIMILSD